VVRVIRAQFAAAVIAILLLAGCTSSSTGRASIVRPTGSPSASTTTPPAGSSAQYYVSIGDSYAAGYQASGQGTGATTRNGFAYQLVGAAAPRGYRFSLVNFGCSGATTTSMLTTPGCASSGLAPGGKSYATKPQAGAAEDFIRANRARIGLVTVSIGGNDITSCALSSNPLGCLPPVLNTVKKNLATLLTGLRAAAGPDVRIVGTTYPDVALAGALLKDPTAQLVAPLSVIAFKTLINPALQSAYQAVGASFADVTAATGAYGALTDTTTLAPYGTVPVPVAKVCQLTFMCEFQDIHPRTSGYALIAGLIAAQLPKR
jgi:lysophospholipase L1-like esterase